MLFSRTAEFNVLDVFLPGIIIVQVKLSNLTAESHHAGGVRPARVRPCLVATVVTDARATNALARRVNSGENIHLSCVDGDAYRTCGSRCKK